MGPPLQLHSPKKLLKAVCNKLVFSILDAGLSPADPHYPPLLLLHTHFSPTQPCLLVNRLNVYCKSAKTLEPPEAGVENSKLKEYSSILKQFSIGHDCIK